MLSHRSDLPALLVRLGLVNEGVELGVARGAFSDHLLTHAPIRRLWSIDAWAGDRGHDFAECAAATRRLARHGGRCLVLRARFDEALGLFADGTLDFVYVDGYAHTGNEAGRTLLDWWPKVRPGGLFGGHDYAPEWPRNVEAVDRFREVAGIADGQFWITAADRYPSWGVIRSI